MSGGGGEGIFGYMTEGVGAFLIHADGSPLLRFQFVVVFRKCSRALGLEEKEFSSHSFRIGAATEAARCGLDDDTVKCIGRWESQRYQIYVRPTCWLLKSGEGGIGNL